jgi:hypothetical protein
MSHITAMLDAYPKDLGNIDRQRLADCIHACFVSGETCTACADACLAEDMVAELTKCIRTNLDCADICTTTGAVLSRHTGYDANITRALLEACRVACASCATECEAHADMHEHCRICAEACRHCEQACADLLGSLGCRKRRARHGGRAQLRRDLLLINYVACRARTPVEGFVSVGARPYRR